MLPVSLTFAGAMALLNLWLAMRIVRTRFATKTMIGDGESEALRARTRAHANFGEYTPFVLILVALLELAGRSRTWLWAVAVVYLLGRVAHAFGIERPAPNPVRAVGAVTTWLVLLGLAVWAIVVASSPEATAHVTYL